MILVWWQTSVHDKPCNSSNMIYDNLYSFCMICIEYIIFLFKYLNIWLENISIENITTSIFSVFFYKFIHLCCHSNSFQSSPKINIVFCKFCSSCFCKTVLHKYTIPYFNETTTITIWMTIWTKLSIMFFSCIKKCFSIRSTHFSYDLSSLSSIFIGILENSLRSKVTWNSRSIFTFSRRSRAYSCSDTTF